MATHGLATTFPQMSSAPAARTVDAAAPRRRSIVAWITPTRLRLFSGLWLLTYAATHLINHALGMVSLVAAENGRAVFLAFWRIPLVETTLLAALLLHAGLGVWSLWQRRSLRMGATNTIQIILGLLIPTYLAAHVMGTGWLHRCCGVTDSYSFVLGRVWPQGVGTLTVMLLVIWLHGAIGLHCWARLHPAYRRLQPWLLMIATLIPVLALAGVVSGGRETAARRSIDPAAWSMLATQQNWPTDAQRAMWVDRPTRWIETGFVGLIVVVSILWVGRWLWSRRRDIRLTYPGGRTIMVPRGLSILEASRLSGIPHASVCGGHGRCSTCRVRVGQGRERLPPPSTAERRVLRRIAAAADVRLACQTRPMADLVVTPLMPAAATAADVLSPMAPRYGIEREVAVLFADLRNFTHLSESWLPYDTVFILNRYFGAMGSAIEAAGGLVDKFIGDGVMALFGVNGAADAAAGAALTAARGMADALEDLNRELAAELDVPLHMGMGLHLGTVILGEMGHGRARSLTAIGDVVNVASRLETLTKELGCQLVVSQSVTDRAGISILGATRRDVDVRGRTGRLAVLLVADAADLPRLPATGADRHRGWQRALSLLSWGQWCRGRTPPA